MTDEKMFRLKVAAEKFADIRRYRAEFDGVIYEHEVYVRETETERSFALSDAPMHTGFSVSSHNKELDEKLVGSRLIEWSPTIREVDISHRFSLVPDATLFQLVEFKRKDDGKFIGGIRFGFDSSNWKKPWSFNEYLEEISKVIGEQNTVSTGFAILNNEQKRGGRQLLIALPEPNVESLLAEEILKSKQALEFVHKLVEESLSSKIRAGSVVTHFDFPEEVRIPCEQYLLYFIQFLKDFGVEATAELQHEAGKVLFSVTPADKDAALDNIRVALDTYLRLAASPVNSASVLNTDIEVQRLSANIQHLQGQLTLAHAVLQTKDATIQQQQLSIAQQRQMLTGAIVLESMKDVTPKPKDSEEVLGGLAEITKYEGTGFNLNLPEAFRRLRQLFTEKKGSKK